MATSLSLAPSPSLYFYYKFLAKTVLPLKNCNRKFITTKWRSKNSLEQYPSPLFLPL